MASQDRPYQSPAVIRPRTSWIFKTEIYLFSWFVILVVTPIGNHDDEHSVHQIVQRALHQINQLSPPKQVAVGGVSGMYVDGNSLKLSIIVYFYYSAAGYCFAKASKMVAFTIGASIIGLAVSYFKKLRILITNYCNILSWYMIINLIQQSPEFNLHILLKSGWWNKKNHERVCLF